MQYEGVELEEENGKYYFRDKRLANENNQLDNRDIAFMIKHKLRIISASPDMGFWDMLTPAQREQAGLTTKKDLYLRQNPNFGSLQCMSWHDKRGHITNGATMFIEKGGDRRRVYTLNIKDLELEHYKQIAAEWRNLGFYVDVSVIESHYGDGRCFVCISSFPIRLVKSVEEYKEELRGRVYFQNDRYGSSHKWERVALRNYNESHPGAALFYHNNGHLVKVEKDANEQTTVTKLNRKTLVALLEKLGEWRKAVYTKTGASDKPSKAASSFASWLLVMAGCDSLKAYIPDWEG